MYLSSYYGIVINFLSQVHSVWLGEGNSLSFIIENWMLEKYCIL